MLPPSRFSLQVLAEREPRKVTLTDHPSLDNSEEQYGTGYSEHAMCVRVAVAIVLQAAIRSGRQ